MDVPFAWREHQVAPFPFSCLQLSVSGIPLVKLDAEVGASLTASLRTDGMPRPLPADRRASLFRCCEQVGAALREVPLDPGARSYFERLQELATVVLSVRG